MGSARPGVILEWVFVWAEGVVEEGERAGRGGGCAGDGEGGGGWSGGGEGCGSGDSIAHVGTEKGHETLLVHHTLHAQGKGRGAVQGTVEAGGRGQVGGDCTDGRGGRGGRGRGNVWEKYVSILTVDLL